MKNKNEYYKIKNFVNSACLAFVRENHHDVWERIQKAADTKFPKARNRYKQYVKFAYLWEESK